MRFLLCMQPSHDTSVCITLHQSRGNQSVLHICTTFLVLSLCCTDVEFEYRSPSMQVELIRDDWLWPVTRLMSVLGNHVAAVSSLKRPFKIYSILGLNRELVASTTAINPPKVNPLLDRIDAIYCRNRSWAQSVVQLEVGTRESCDQAHSTLRYLPATCFFHSICQMLSYLPSDRQPVRIPENVTWSFVTHSPFCKPYVQSHSVVKVHHDMSFQ